MARFKASFITSHVWRDKENDYGGNILPDGLGHASSGQRREKLAKLNAIKGLFNSCMKR